MSEGISAGDCAVMSWGGLRGAVSLALALIVAQRVSGPVGVGRPSESRGNLGFENGEVTQTGPAPGFPGFRGLVPRPGLR